MKTLNELGYKLSAYAGGALHSRDSKTAMLRTLAVGGVLVSVLTLSATNAMATDLTNYASKITTKTNVTLDIISYLCYLGGGGLAALGIVDLKKHVENPQTPLKNGLAKLGFGGALLALPYVTTVMQGTTGTQHAGATFNKFTNKGSI